jgi:acetolactate decarboxylase
MKPIIILFLLLPLFTCEKQEDPQENISIRTVDTYFSKGRLGLEHDIILNDLEKFHGHLCDGLVVGFQGMNEGLKVLYPDGKVDRTNTRVVSKPSPCLTDAAAYLTGGRYQFNTFYVSKDIDGLFVVQRIDTRKTVGVYLNKGIKPDEIDRLGSLAVKGELGGCELDELQKLEDDFSELLLNGDPDKNFTIQELSDFEWDPVFQNDFVKTDILNKDQSNCNQ